MYKVTKTMEVAGMHWLSLPYKSKCSNEHGHNWLISVEVASPELNKEGMVADFSLIKDILNQLDHQNLNKVLEGKNPTAEVIAKWIADEVNSLICSLHINADPAGHDPCVTRVTVRESEGNVAEWRLYDES
jgi:6-pyruvoyltetrahydropterin/6-carboxytetrahydropterin synthase